MKMGRTGCDDTRAYVAYLERAALGVKKKKKVGTW